MNRQYIFSVFFCLFRDLLLNVPFFVSNNFGAYRDSDECIAIPGLILPCLQITEKMMSAYTGIVVMFIRTHH